MHEKQPSVAEWILLRELHKREQAAPGELAAHPGLTRGAVSKDIDKLKAKAGLKRMPGRDNRYRLFSMTRRGAQSTYLAQIADENNAAHFARVDGFLYLAEFLKHPS